MNRPKFIQIIIKWIAEIVILSIIFSIIYPCLVIVLYFVMSLFDRYRSILDRLWTWENIWKSVLDGAMMGFLLGLIFGGIELIVTIYPPKK